MSSPFSCDIGAAWPTWEALTRPQPIAERRPAHAKSDWPQPGYRLLILWPACTLTDYDKVPARPLCNITLILHLLTCSLMGPWIFYHLMGGGVVENPLLTRHIDFVARNRKCIRKLVRNDNESISVNFSLRSILRPPEVIKHQI